MSGHDKASFNRGVRASVKWLHDEASRMNDPNAKSILNGAAFHLGAESRFGYIPHYPDADILALLKRAEAALEPFNVHAEQFTPDMPDTIMVPATIGIGDLRRAASVLSDLRDVLKEQA